MADFSKFEREAAELLAQMRRAVTSAEEFASESRAGKASVSETRSRAYEPGPTGGVSSAEASEIRARGLATDQLVAKQRALTQAETASANSERVFAQVMSQNSGQMQRSGALTNEFVEAAKRGEITVRELGAEVTGTIAKFGGWIVAGSAVYFAFDALTALKKGAIDASSGVNELERVVNHVSAGGAEEKFRSLAQEFNVPIEAAADAAYEMGKVYNNQNDAFSAARQVLYAVKIGELDTAAASKYLISIINGFHLPASRMAQVFDQVNEAQNNFGISTEDVLSGVAKASGTFHQASGEYKKYGEDYSYLLALITTGSKVTGQTGASVGTAIARSPGFLRKPSNQETLRQFGIDPNGAIEDVYNEAFKKAQSLSGKQVQILASALGGPQLGAKVFTGLLSNYTEFKKVLGDTSPANSQGSAQRELSKQLGGVDEQISKIGVSLERLGAEGAKSHFFDSLGAGLAALNGMLELANALATDFGKLPGPVQQMLAYLIQASVVLKVLRRLNLGETVAGGPGSEPGAIRGGAARFLGHESPDAFARQTRKAFFAEQEALERERSRLGGQLYRGQRKETLAYGAAGSANEEVQSAVASHGALSAEAAAAQKKAVAAQAEASAATQANLRIALDEQAATERLAAVQTSIAATRKKVIGGLNVEATLAEAERLHYPVPAGFGGKGTERPITISRGVAAAAEGERAAASAGAATVAASSSLGGLIRTTETQTEEAGVSTTKVTRGLGGLSGSFGRFGGALGSMGGAMSGLLGRAGELAFAAITIGFLSDALTNIADEATKDIEGITQGQDTSKARLERIKSLQAGSSDGTNFGQRVSEVFNERVQVGPVNVPTLGLGKPFGANASKSINEEEAEIEKGEIKNIEDELALQRKARSEGTYVPFRYVGEITKDIEHVKKSGKSRKQINDALEKYEEELVHSHSSPHQGAEIKKAQALIKEGQVEAASNRDLVEKLQELQTKEIDARLQSTLGQIGGSDGVQFSRKVAQQASLIYQAEVQKIGKANDPASLQQLAQARQGYFDGITTAIQNELQFQLDVTKSPAGENRAYSTAVARLEAFASSGKDEQRKQEQEVAALRQRKARAESDQKKTTYKVSGSIFGGFHITKEGGESTDTKELDKEIELGTQKLKEIRETQQQKARYIRDIVLKLREQQFEANAALRSAQEGAREALTANPITQTEEKIDFLNEEIGRAIKVYGRNSQQVLQLITEARQEQQTLVQNQLGLLQAKGNLATAGIIQAIPKEKAQLYGQGGLIAQLQFEEAHRNDFDPKTIIELQAQVEGAKAQLEFDIYQEATQVADARFGVKEAQANYSSNPVEAAKIAVEKAEYDLKRAKTPQEKIGAQQQLIQAVTTKREDVANARLETINYEASINKITTQQEIEQLEQLLQSYKIGLSAKRQIREQIHSLKSQLASEGQGFNLNVGDFSLPTAYDIRRAIVGSGGRNGPSVSQHNTFNVKNYSSDPNVVGRAIGGVLGGAAESAARSAGIAG